jgi:hypothetical protein
MTAWFAARYLVLILAALALFLLELVPRAEAKKPEPGAVVELSKDETVEWFNFVEQFQSFVGRQKKLEEEYAVAVASWQTWQEKVKKKHGVEGVVLNREAGPDGKMVFRWVVEPPKPKPEAKP